MLQCLKSIRDVDYIHMVELKSYKHGIGTSVKWPRFLFLIAKCFHSPTFNFSSVASDHHIQAAAAAQHDCNLWTNFYSVFLLL